MGIEDSICVTPAERLSDICPESNCIYTLKGVSFEIFARKALKITLMMRPDNGSMNMGGLVSFFLHGLPLLSRTQLTPLFQVVDLVRIQRHDPVHHFDDFEFAELNVRPITLPDQQFGELEIV
jgi:hypothetical protein